MKLIADSGSTKTDWCVMDGSRVVQRMAGQGINPFQQSPPVILKTITDDTAKIIIFSARFPFGWHYFVLL